MSRKDNHTYRHTRRCATCHWADLKLYGQGWAGYYCTRYQHRCCKTNVCDSHMTEDEYELLTDWGKCAEYFREGELTIKELTQKR